MIVSRVENVDDRLLIGDGDIILLFIFKSNVPRWFWSIWNHSKFESFVDKFGELGCDFTTHSVEICREFFRILELKFQPI